MNLNALKLVLWYDNKLGYLSNLLNQIKLVNKK
jgi:glyceraldehyde-3-phosphate dehydrogenase/erythrose-4-phosphate dehydrogenase